MDHQKALELARLAQLYLTFLRRIQEGGQMQQQPMENWPMSETADAMGSPPTVTPLAPWSPMKKFTRFPGQSNAGHHFGV